MLSSVIVGILHRSTLISREKMQALLQKTMDEVIVHNTKDDCSLAIMARASNDLPTFAELSTQEKMALLDIKADRNDQRNKNKQVARCDIILDMLDKPTALHELVVTIQDARNVREVRDLKLKAKHIHISLELLEQSGLIVNDSGLFVRSAVG